MQAARPGAEATSAGSYGMIHEPILLIHGFNGWPTNWTGPEDRFPEFLADHGYDPELIRVFTYGYREYRGKNLYNNTGDIREIAHRLDEASSPDPELQECAVERLSEASQARGGPAKITIISHSSGGLVARYYLSCKAADEFGTRYRGNVGRVIFLGTPHQGADVEDLLDPIPSNLLLYRLLVRLPFLFPREYAHQTKLLRDQLHDLRQTTRRELFGATEPGPEEEMPAFLQIHPRSAFLDGINRPGAMPGDVAFYNIIGDFRAAVRIEASGKRLVDSEKSFGDFLVSTKSAGEIPNAPSECRAMVKKTCLDVDLTGRVSNFVALKHEGQPQLPIHRHLRSLPEARAHILDFLNPSEAAPSGDNHWAAGEPRPK